MQLSMPVVCRHIIVNLLMTFINSYITLGNMPYQEQFCLILPASLKVISATGGHL